MATLESQRVFEQAMAQLGLTPRPQQQALVDHARETVASFTEADPKNKTIQAGTGVGKSYANLTCAVEASRLTGRPSVVVCPNNRLIDQYVEKDAPKVAQATGARIEYLKGRNRYLCAESYGFDTKFGRDAIKEFRRMVETGRLEWAQHYGLDESFGCDGNCENTPEVCGVQHAREKLAGCAVIITNGHILVYDQLVRDWTAGQSRLLPAYGALFVDECHELDSVVRSCLSDQVGPNAQVYEQIKGLKRWVMSQITEAGLSERNREVAINTDDPELQKMAQDAQRRLSHVIRKMDEVEAAGDKAVAKNLKKESKALQRFIDFASPYDPDSDFVSSISVEPDQTYPGGLKPTLNRLCIDGSLTSRPIITEQPTVLVSGTVPPSLTRRLGLTNTNTGFHDVGTPFDYSKSKLAISSHDPRASVDLTARLTDLVKGVAQMAQLPHSEGGGGTLVLVTSWSDLDLVSQYLAQNLPQGIPVLTQHRTDAADTAEMLEYFAEHGNAVLVGVRSLWTGVDIPGPALRQVMIWKMPYPVPTIEMKAVEARFGKGVYYDETYQLLAQGIGRLVRTTEDDGRVVIMDCRAQRTSWRSNPMTVHVADFAQYKRPAPAQ